FPAADPAPDVKDDGAALCHAVQFMNDLRQVPGHGAGTIQHHADRAYVERGAAHDEPFPAAHAGAHPLTVSGAHARSVSRAAAAAGATQSASTHAAAERAQ